MDLSKKSETKSKRSPSKDQAKTASTKSSTDRSKIQPESCYNLNNHFDTSKLLDFVFQTYDGLDSEGYKLLKYAKLVLDKSAGDLNKWHFHNAQTLAELLGMQKTHYLTLERKWIAQGWIQKRKASDKRGDVSSWRRLGPRFDFFRQRCVYKYPMMDEIIDELSIGGSDENCHEGSDESCHEGSDESCHEGSDENRHPNLMNSKPMNFKPMNGVCEKRAHTQSDKWTSIFGGETVVNILADHNKIPNRRSGQKVNFIENVKSWNKLAREELADLSDEDLQDFVNWIVRETNGMLKLKVGIFQSLRSEWQGTNWEPIYEL